MDILFIFTVFAAAVFASIGIDNITAKNYKRGCYYTLAGFILLTIALWSFAEIMIGNYESVFKAVLK